MQSVWEDIDFNTQVPRGFARSDRPNYPNYPDVYDILFDIKNMDDGHEALNFCILHIKYYIYKQRLFHGNTLSIREICNEIRYKLDIEKKICENDDKQMNFDK